MGIEIRGKGLVREAEVNVNGIDTDCAEGCGS